MNFGPLVRSGDLTKEAAEALIALDRWYTEKWSNKETSMDTLEQEAQRRWEDLQAKYLIT